MIQIGAYHVLRVARMSEFGAFLTDGAGDVLLPRKYVPKGIEPGAEIKVFVATDSEDRPVATTLRPKGVVGEFAALRAADVTPVGAFMDWGLDKDLLVPFAEQQRRIEPGDKCLVRIVFDERTNRLFGSTKLGRYLTGNPAELSAGQKVELTVADAHPAGTRVVIEGRFYGMVFPDEMTDRLEVGQKRAGFIKRVRDDGEIAVSLSPAGYQGALEARSIILDRLRREGGFLPVGDKSSPEEIRRLFGLSKGTFKKAVGMLYKSGEIEITYHGLRAKAQE
jgi:predicted RNA-binding protein (virulence factor B family)